MKALTLSILVLSLAYATTLSAQDNREDVIYLKNGSIYRGVLVEQVPGVSYKIEIAGGSVINLKAEEIEKINKEQKVNTLAYDNYRYRRQPQPFVYRDSGYFFQGLIEAGFFEAGFRIINGYKFNQFTYLGFGVGVDGIASDVFKNKNIYFGGAYIPVFAYFAGDVLHQKITPFYQVSAGYTFWHVTKGNDPLELVGGIPGAQINSPRGGFMGSAGFGVKFYTPNRANIAFSGNVDIKNPSAIITSFYYYDYRSSPWLVIPSFMFGVGF